MKLVELSDMAEGLVFDYRHGNANYVLNEIGEALNTLIYYGTENKQAASDMFPVMTVLNDYRNLVLYLAKTTEADKPEKS